VRHPAVLERLVAEADAGEQAYARGRQRVPAPAAGGPLAGRRLAAPLRVDGRELPAETDVTPAIWLAHTRADRYPEPLAFRPERFLDGAPSSFAWIPFGGGVRRCIGAAFAEMEMRVALAEILRHRTLRSASGSAEHVARRNVTFSPAGGTRVIAAARRPATAAGYEVATASGAERLSA
jgi:cytochrome P450